MGVILVNMISGRNPWRYATADDQCFQAFLSDNNFLGNVLPISAEVNMIIKRIFTIDPLRRISLEKLKEEIIQVRTFFKSQRQLKSSHRPLQAEKLIEPTDSSWQTVSEPAPAKPNRVVVEAEGGALSSPILQPTTRPVKLKVPVPGPDNKTGTSAANSSKSSLVVKTPSVHPVAPVTVAYPNGNPDNDVEEPLILPGTLLDKVLRSPGGKPKSITLKSGRNLLRAAVQRIKEFSAPTNGNGGA